jgi:hypothetical protein
MDGCRIWSDFSQNIFVRVRAVDLFVGFNGLGAGLDVDKHRGVFLVFLGNGVDGVQAGKQHILRQEAFCGQSATSCPMLEGFI